MGKQSVMTADLQDAEFKNNRVHKRYCIECAAEVVHNRPTSNEGTIEKCIVHNVSIRGACIQFSGVKKRQIGEMVVLNVQIENQRNLLISGEITWFNPFNSTAGIRFKTP